MIHLIDFIQITSCLKYVCSYMFHSTNVISCDWGERDTLMIGKSSVVHMLTTLKHELFLSGNTFLDYTYNSNCLNH
ncbi:hypothetical protein LINPERHAP1_LOCUS32556 [Linum perenne]